LAKRKSLRATDLDQAGFITYPKDPQSRFAEHTVASHLGFCLVGRSVGRGSRRDLAFVPVAHLKDKAAVFAVTKVTETSKLVSSFVDTLVATSRS
jgi:hypothetical protein